MSEEEHKSEHKSEQKYTILTQSQEEYERMLQSLNTVTTTSIVELNFNEDALRSNFKTITDILKKQYQLLNVCTNNLDNLMKQQEEDKRIEQMMENYKDLKDLIDKLMRDNGLMTGMMNQLKDQIDNNQDQELKDKSAEQEQKIFDLEQQLRDLLNNYEKMKNEGQQQQGDGGSKGQARLGEDDLRRLYDLIDDLKKQLDDLEKENEELKQLMENDKGNDKNMQKIQEQIDELNKRIKELENQMMDKVNCEDFDNLVAQIKAQQGNQQTGPVKTEESRVTIPNSREGNRIGSLEKKIKDQEELCKRLQDALNQLKDQVEDQEIRHSDAQQRNNEQFGQLGQKNKGLDEQLAKLLERIKKCEDGKLDRDELKGFNKDKFKKELMDIINKIKEQVSNNLGRIEVHNSEIDDMKRKVDTIQKKNNDMGKKQNNKKDGADLSKVKEMIDQAINGLRDEILGMIKDLQQQLNKKIGGEDDLLLYQQKIFQKIDEIVGALIKQLANKNETKKALSYLEKKIQELYMLVNPDEKNRGDLDALLVKRPLFWSCVSCDKDLDQYQGRLGDYRNWKVFPPKETSPERMGRFGVGYQQMMQNRKQNIDKEKEMMKEKNEQNQSGTNTQMNTRQNFNKSHNSGLPELHQKDDKAKYVVRK